MDADRAAPADAPLPAGALASEIARFDGLVRTLRERCPWDREQTHTTLRRHLLEEAYETLETLDRRAGLGDDEVDESLDDHLCEELGDLLYQVWFQARLASERGAFTMADVVRGVHDKLVARHPHVFGDVEASDSDAVRANWDVIKQAEKGRDSTMDGIPPTLPALLRAVKVLKRAAAAGLMQPADPRGGLDGAGRAEYPPAPPDAAAARRQEAFHEVEGALSGLRAEPSERLLGELLMAAVGLGWRLSIDPEDALRAATQRAEQHYRGVEQAGRGV